MPLAENRINEAKRLAPEFYEVHRVEAFLRVVEVELCTGSEPVVRA
jgi:hypothetical protein